MADRDRSRRVLYVVACGGRPAGDLPAFVRHAQGVGWEVCVIATPSALKFMDLDHLGRLTGHVVRYDYKQPDEPDVLPTADAIVVAPATFNTINKWAAGISDTLALGLLCEAMGMELPVVVLPYLNAAQGKHPALADSIQRLRGCGVQVLFGPDVLPLHRPREGRRELFPWQLTLAALDAS